MFMEAVRQFFLIFLKNKHVFKNNTKVLIVTNKILWKFVKSHYSICKVPYNVHCDNNSLDPNS